MIDWVTVQGFRSVQRIERLKLGRLNVLIGANGSGKSNFIRVFELLRAVCRGNLQHHVRRAGGAEKTLHFGAKETDRIKIVIAFTQPAVRYQIELTPGGDDALHVCSEAIFSTEPVDTNRSQNDLAWSEDRSSLESELFELPTSERPIGAGRLLEHLNGWNIYHFHDTGLFSPFRKTNQLHDNHELHPDGSNLAAFLYLLRAKYESSYRLIRRAVRLVAPFFRDFVLDPEELNEETLRFGWHAEGSDVVFRASSLSDGSLRFIALATLLLQPEKFRPSVILLDEPELGLHPYAITILDSLFKQAAAETQIVFATQSSLLLDHQQPEDVLVADRVNGGTQITRCEDDSERLLEWLEDYSMGQLWLKNEIGGRPVREAAVGGLQR